MSGFLFFKSFNVFLILSPYKYDPGSSLICLTSLDNFLPNIYDDEFFVRLRFKPICYPFSEDEDFGILLQALQGNVCFLAYLMVECITIRKLF